MQQYYSQCFVTEGSEFKINVDFNPKLTIAVKNFDLETISWISCKSSIPNQIQELYNLEEKLVHAKREPLDKCLET